MLFSQECRHDIHSVFRAQADEFRKFWTETFADLGVRDPAQAGLEFTLWNRGIFSIVASCEGNLEERDYAMIERWIIQMMESFLEKPGD